MTMTMTTVQNQAFPTTTTTTTTTTVAASSSYNSSDYYDPDDVVARNSPLLSSLKPSLQPSPTPPPMFLPEITPEGTPDPTDRKPAKHTRNRPSYGDGQLVDLMGDGRHDEVARTAAEQPLTSSKQSQISQTSKRGVIVDRKIPNISPVTTHEPVVDEAPPSDPTCGASSSHVVNDGLYLAAQAVNAFKKQSAGKSVQASAYTNDNSVIERPPVGDPMVGVTSPVPAITVGDAQLQNPTAAAKIDTPTKELPPILQHSSQSGLPNGDKGSITLPSISPLLDTGKNLPDAPTPGGLSNFVQSPPAPMFNPAPNHASSPKSPADSRSLPSPGQNSFYYANKHRRQSSYGDGQQQYPNGVDYSSIVETPSTDHSGAGPPTPAVDKMSIDEITNPQIGVFQCNHSGCTAQPFHTQYLLNSHANVHSQNRPHYCAVKGCSRSEGGKGFKRKNEMKRHGLVHDSPGYVCPFCPDREHKYPRPDNLQRHVRVHHLDKDKDDPQLRDVLSQRNEGPSRIRRRKGGSG